MPSFRRRASVVDADRVDEPPQDPDRTADAAKARALAEEAEAEAAEAEAVVAAARARARALKLRRQAEAAEASTAAADTTEATQRVGVTEPHSGAESKSGAELTGEAASRSEAELTGGAGTVPKEAVTVEKKDEASAAGSGRRFPVRRILKIAAAVLTVAGTCALITLSVLMVLHHRNFLRDQQRSAEYAAAARQSVVTLMSLDFNKAQEDVNRIIDNSTGTFRDDFKNQAADFVKVAQDSKVITDVTVNSVAVESMTDDSAQVLASATSRVTNGAGAKQEPRAWRLSVTLQRDGGQLKMARVEFVP